MSMPSNKTPGPDKVSMSVLKDCLPVVLGPIQWRRQASEFGGAFEGQTHILGGQDRIFKKVLLFAHAVVTGLLSPPQEIRPPSQKGAIFLGIPPPGDEYPRNIAPPREGRMPQEYRPPSL